MSNAVNNFNSNTNGFVRAIRDTDRQQKDLHDVRVAWYNYFRKAKAYEAKYKEDPELRRFKKEVVEAHSTSVIPALDNFLYSATSLVEDLYDSEGANSEPVTLQSLSPQLKKSLGQIGPGYSALVGPLRAPEPINPYKNGEFVQTRPSYAYSTILERKDKDSGEEDYEDDEISARGEPFDGSSASVTKQILTPSYSGNGLGIS